MWTLNKVPMLKLVVNLSCINRTPKLVQIGHVSLYIQGMKGLFRKTTVLSEQTVSTVRRDFEKGIPFSTLLVDECFSRRLVFQWIQKMCSATRRFVMRQTSFDGF